MARTRPAPQVGARAGVAIAAVFVQSGVVFLGYNATSPDRFVFPVTDPVATVQENVGEERLLPLGELLLPPEQQPGLRPAHADALRRHGRAPPTTPCTPRCSAPRATGAMPTRVGVRSLQLFGVDWVLTDREVPEHLLARRAEPGGLGLYETVPGVGRRHLVGRAEVVRDERQAWNRVHAPDWDPTTTVILGPGDAETTVGSDGGPDGLGGPGGEIEVLESTPSRELLRVRRDEPRLPRDVGHVVPGMVRDRRRRAPGR